MLTNLSLKNIKSFNEDATLQIAPITLIYGPNSSGKSSLWKFFLALKESSQRFSQNQFFNIARSDFANIKTLSFDRSKKSIFTINFAKSKKEDSTVFAFNFENPPPQTEANYETLDIKGLEKLKEKKGLFSSLSEKEREVLMGGLNEIIDRYSKPTSTQKKKPQTIDEAVKQAKEETEKEVQRIKNRLDPRRARFQRIEEGENINNLKIDEFKIIQANKDLISFKIVELPKIKDQQSGILFARQSPKVDRLAQETNIKKILQTHYQKNFSDKEFKFEVKVNAKQELYNEFRDGPFNSKRTFDMVGQNGPKELKNLATIDKMKYLFLPTQVSKDKKLWIKYFDFLQFLKTRMIENNKSGATDPKVIFEGYINEHFFQEHMYLENTFGVDSDEFPEIKKTHEKTLRVMLSDIDEFIDIMSEDLETFIMSGSNFIPDHRFYGARIFKVIFDEIADKFLDSYIGNVGPDGELEPLSKKGKEFMEKFEELIPFSIIDQVRNLFKFNEDLSKFKKSNFNSPFPLATTGANYGITKSLSSGIHEDEEYKKKIIKFLEIIDLPFEIRSKLDDNGNINLSFENKKISNLENTSKEIPLDQSGNALKSILLLLADILRSKESVIILEEPENKLHPKIQGNLIELLTSITNENRNQILIETHSEHFLLRIQKLIREKKIKPSDIAINYVYLDENGQGSKIDHMELDDSGKFLNKWRHGFFNERLSEL
jgi:predicted ATPase